MIDEITVLCRQREAVDVLLGRVMEAKDRELLENILIGIEKELEIVVADNHTLSI